MFALSTRGNQKAIKWLSENTSYKAVNETTNTAGGYLVPDELVAELIFLRETYGVVRQNATIRTMHSDTLWIPKNSASTTAYWVGESTAITQSQPTFDRVQVLAKKLGILTPVTSEINEDSIIEIGAALAQDMAWKFAQEEDRVCMIGSAANATDGNIDGFITANLGVASNAGSINAATGSAANYNAVTLANFRTMVGKLPLYADNQDAKWYMSKAFFNDVVCNRLDALSGNAALDLMNFNSGRPSLLGYPIVFSQHLASTAAGTTGTALCSLANLKTGTVLGDRRQVNIKVSTDYLFNTDEIAFKATERFGFSAHDPGTSSAAGSIIVLKRLT
jgi:HK97 family phage major capsid protein